MRLFHRVVIAVALAMLVAMPSARAQNSDNPSIYMVNYIEATPAAKSKVVSMLKQLADAARKEPGALRFEVLQRTVPAHHFAILEVWKDQQALDAHTAAAHTKQFRDRLAPLLMAPFDDRLCVAIAVSPIQPIAARARYVITHVDIGPPNPANRDKAIPDLTAFSDMSRKDTGNLRYDVLQQKARTNHFKVVEVWKDQKSEDAHEAAAHSMELRAKFAPMMGSLYDQRWYNAL